MIEKELGALLNKNGYSLAIAESCTGGLISNYITNIPGASKYFLGGIIAYSNDIKINVLKVKKETIEKYGAVSEECAKEMVLGITNLFQSDVGIATTGIAGPAGGTSEKPVGLVYIGLKIKGNLWVMKHIFKGDRSEIKNKMAKKAIEETISRLTLSK